jgi:predicted AAA+ superfamily ATPase
VPIHRILQPPAKSFLLLGPRGTGKSTFLKNQLQADVRIDLLDSRQFLELSRNPAGLRDLVAHLKPKQWVVVDEVQRIPALLNEVHALYEELRLNFALSGSSARKLKRGGANLLAGRALQAFLFPLVAPEIEGLWSIRHATEWGTLPAVVTESIYKERTLAAYVEMYLRQELLEEGIIRKLDPFVRFLEIAGLMNAQVINFQNIARECGVGRTTVQTYFEILEDTLLGFRLPAYRPGGKTREVAHSKFYFFDAGVARACAGLLDEPVDAAYRGFLFETFLINQLRAFNHYAQKNRGLFFYKLSGGAEIDLIVETKKKTLSNPAEVICLEIKSTEKWDARWCKPAADFSDLETVKVKRRIGVYWGNSRLSQHGFDIFPADAFLRELFAGTIF